MMMTNLLIRANEIAHTAHRGQTDKAGNYYILHPCRVASMVESCGGTEAQIAAAWLHDTVEDTDVTLSYIEEECGHDIAAIVHVLTHFRSEPRATYINRVRSHPDAILVKLCDIADNLDPLRLYYLPEATQRRLRIKYAKDILRLCED